MKKLANFYDINQAQALASMLDANGIECDIRNEHTGTMYWLYTNAIGGYHIMVSSDCLSEANDILSLYNTDASYQKCPSCSSSKIRYIKIGALNALAIFLGGFCFPARKHKMKCDNCNTVFNRDELVEESDEALDELEKLALESKTEDTKPGKLPIYFAFLKGYIITVVLMALTAPLRPYFVENDSIEYYLHGAYPYLYAPLIGGAIGVLLRCIDEYRKKRLEESGGDNEPAPPTTRR